ncbi:U3 small nucleolar RNA-associated protein 25 isoform X2 [Cynara cardunculus var. scolymus]|uniref:U3 small nucleolar RNA-associated protein 25 isoform X2 n=1 Tax=Cynara cardunculus var. scolymus TaxID=59895 RepID=UPI000D62622F|nr:U3 small nucleolar RNA-associated protein 25 isoform X2 [Cynara cardunculus var. scolymus]
MAKSRFAIKRGFSRPRTNESPRRIMNKRARRNHADDEKVPDNPSSTSDSGTSSEEHSNIASEEEQDEVVAYKEPSMYDSLLKTLGSASESIADAYKRRQRAEEGRSDTDEDQEDDLESLSVSEEDEDGSEDGSPGSALDLTDIDGSSLADIGGHIEDDDDEASDMDEEEEVTANGQSIAKESEISSSFSAHLDYKLLKDEVEILSRKKGKYKWEVDAANCKWVATRELILEDSYMNSPYGLNLKLYDHWLNNYEASGGHDLHSSRQRSFFSLCNSYRDILHHNKKPFYLKGREEDSSIMDAYLLHSLNHVFKTRDLVTKNDKKLATRKEAKHEEILDSENFLDQGFTRPKVLILLPMASIAYRVVKRLIQLTPAGHKVNVEHIDRFSDGFGPGRSDEQQDEDGISKSWKTSKPSDFQALFGGNNNDHFMIGIKFTKKTIKLYSDFYTSDMIVASPLGLITKIGEAEVEKEKDVDYLSSIEVLIVDHADVIAMQNWSHVNTVVEQLNSIPSKQHGTDIMRIRPWYLDGQARFYRQTIILGSHVNPDINALFNNHCLNYEGRVKLSFEHKGVLPKVLLQVRQIYERIDTESIVDADDARLDYFKKKVFPKIKDSVQGGIMIFISSYFEFVRVRNFLKSQDASMCLLGEYTKQSDISRSRVWFFQGKRKIMLYTERAHFYHRYKIRGIQNLIIYSLPERKEFYPEIVNMLEGSHSMNCTVLFSRFDLLRLERVVGTVPAKRMVTSDKCIFTFC